MTVIDLRVTHPQNLLTEYASRHAPNAEGHDQGSEIPSATMIMLRMKYWELSVQYVSTPDAKTLRDLKTSPCAPREYGPSPRIPKTGLL